MGSTPHVTNHQKGNDIRSDVVDEEKRKKRRHRKEKMCYLCAEEFPSSTQSDDAKFHYQDVQLTFRKQNIVSDLWKYF